MVIARCPLRISLVGGSTDTVSYLEKYETGSVISFPCNLYTYVMIKPRRGNYRIVYSKIEEENDVENIKNDIAREVIKYFNLPTVEFVFNSDIPSTGSGLASSSSYLVASVEACFNYLRKEHTQFFVCKIALEIEKKINPLTGYQDCVGCGIGGLKRLNFKKNGDISIQYLESSVLNENFLFLYATEKSRKSTQILNTLDLEKCNKLIEDVDRLQNNLNNTEEFYNIIKNSWELKKQTSPYILTEDMVRTEEFLKDQVDCYKLCGAGGGGFFFLMKSKDFMTPLYNNYNIQIDNIGVVSMRF